MSDTTESPAGDDVTRLIENGICWITLNRPDAGNAMTAAMRDQITAWVTDASDDLFVRVVVITAAGEKAFCTGADLRGGRPAPRPRPDGAPDLVVGEGARVIRNGWQRLVGSIIDCEKPVIAGVNGTAAGGGMHLALACDLVVAAEESKFIEVFIRRGIAPDAGGAWLLTRLDRHPKDQGAVLLRRRSAGRRGLPHRTGQSSGAAGRAGTRRWRSWPPAWPMVRPRPSASPSG